MISKPKSFRFSEEILNRLNEITKNNNMKSSSETLKRLILNYSDEKIKPMKNEIIDQGIFLEECEYVIYNLTKGIKEKSGNISDYINKINIHSENSNFRIIGKRAYFNTEKLYNSITKAIFNADIIKDYQKSQKVSIGFPDFELNDCFVEFKFDEDLINYDQINFAFKKLDKDYKILWIRKK